MDQIVIIDIYRLSCFTVSLNISLLCSCALPLTTNSKRSQQCPVPLFSHNCTVQQCHSADIKPKVAQSPSQRCPHQPLQASVCEQTQPGLPRWTISTEHRWGSGLLKTPHQPKNKHSTDFAGGCVLKDGQTNLKKERNRRAFPETLTSWYFSPLGAYQLHSCKNKPPPTESKSKGLISGPCRAPELHMHSRAQGCVYLSKA